MSRCEVCLNGAALHRLQWYGSAPPNGGEPVVIVRHACNECREKLNAAVAFDISILEEAGRSE